ncbi:hypothetical protein CHH92_02125 [Bacillus sonorensis]|nr:hypothetical protein CHH92_02125 [Bacillus sonorensis]
MRNGRVRIDIEGVNRVVRALEYEGLVRDIGNTTEAYTRKMANESADYAPVKTGRLRNSIVSSPEEIDQTTWEYGSTKITRRFKNTQIKRIRRSSENPYGTTSCRIRRK